MASVLEVSGLSKDYGEFKLEDVHFSLETGRVMGFIGRNGAGKTTTLKCLINFVHPDAGRIRFFGEEFQEAERDIKERIGYVTGGVSFYPKMRLRTLTRITREFYRSWQDDAYRRYMQRFNLDEDKTPAQLSEGMKVKYALALALSHRAELLLLDEPTSGLDPLSREELIDIFLSLAHEEGCGLLFSTHITEDLDKCADDIAYIRDGRIVYAGALDPFVSGYRAVRYETQQPPEEARPLLIGCKRAKSGCTALVRAQDAAKLSVQTQPADLETIMIHMERA